MKLIEAVQSEIGKQDKCRSFANVDSLESIFTLPSKESTGYVVVAQLSRAQYVLFIADTQDECVEWIKKLQS